MFASIVRTYQCSEFFKNLFKFLIFAKYKYNAILKYTQTHIANIVVTLALTLIMVLTGASWELGAQYWYNGHRCINVDDYSQYVPLAAGLGLGLVGVESKHCFTDRLLVSATSAVAVGVMVRG